MTDKIAHRSHRVPADLSHFWAITVISNSQRYKKRFENYHRFANLCQEAGVKLVTVEIAFGDRDLMVTDPRNPRHVCLRSAEELWHKENMIDLGVQRAQQLDPLIREVAWIDADLRPMATPRHWFEETWHELQHYEFVQMFEWFQNLDTEFNPLDSPRYSFMGAYMRGQRPTEPDDDAYFPGQFWLGCPGGAWACNISAYRAVGGLIDFCILGSADWHMAQGLLGLLEPKRGEVWSSGYSKKLYEWQERALRWIKKDVGVVNGGCLHDNHGPKKNRFYVERKQILSANNFEPDTDLKYDHQGLLQLETYDDRQISLRDGIRRYFRVRLEDMPEYKGIK